ncbi:Dynein regulatory complex subunit 6 [Mortierella sp. AM989]|nr:Dynein regulatory complex subunit 6 [Mortierella sp. AM989]
MALENNLDLEHSIETVTNSPSQNQSPTIGPGSAAYLQSYQYSSPYYLASIRSGTTSYNNSFADLHHSQDDVSLPARPIGIHSLKPSLLRYIFSFLSVQHYDYLNHRTHTLYNHLGPASLVCKIWNDIASPLLWQERTFHGWKAGEGLHAFLQLTENADFSSTHEYGEFVKRIEIIDSHDVVDKQNGEFVINWITPDVVLALSEHCSKRLRDLTLIFATGRQISTETEEGLIPWMALAESCRRLFVLSLTNYICPILPVGKGHPFHMLAAHTNPLAQLVLKRCKNIPSETFKQLARTCGKALTKLVLLDSDECLSTDEMIEFAQHCPNLRHINVSWIESVIPKINDEVLLRLTSNCPRLEYISLLDANEISDTSFQTISKLHYLRNLILPRAGTAESEMSYSQESLIALAKNCRRLEQLHLVAPGATTSKFFEALLYCPHLQVLVIVELNKGLLIDQRFKTLGLTKYVDPEATESYKLVWHKKT